ncbi:hypothetical protein BJJ98_03750 [Dickeya solani]|nr:hypothetical protein A4U42_17250 [Dickeya solani IPO 2222]AUH07663.1 hypothetical protein BJD21_03785 [Dickeya solani D s0432-1]AUH11690.1 hypothetical protein BJJ98_03750 [Dickeya solani]
MVASCTVNYRAAIRGEDGQFFCLLCQLTLKAGVFSHKLVFALRPGQLLQLLAAPGIKLGFIQAEFTGSSSDTNTLSQFQGFIAQLGLSSLQVIYYLAKLFRVDISFSFPSLSL